ncbi:homeobox protein cut-like [Caerostris darwini]|uniref:Homeobox protein cut-like n=1 Tax=Caerostris darwini TaxID=1538125 RepID=A0AAV4MYK8_9ARAC|nr:homeobox protein cut-like [Caerostris darwini]
MEIAHKVVKQFLLFGDVQSLGTGLSLAGYVVSKSGYYEWVSYYIIHLPPFLPFEENVQAISSAIMVEVTIKLLREKVREFEDKEESTVQEKAEEKDPEFVHLFDEKESDQLGSEFAVKPNLEEAETKVAQLQSALDRSQSELFDLKSRYDEDSNAKSDEMEVIVNDLERANQVSADLN